MPTKRKSRSIVYNSNKRKRSSNTPTKLSQPSQSLQLTQPSQAETEWDLKDDAVYLVKDITDENDWAYWCEWEVDPRNGQAYPGDWVKKEWVSKGAVREWKALQAARISLESSSPVTTGDVSLEEIIEDDTASPTTVKKRKRKQYPPTKRPRRRIIDSSPRSTPPKQQDKADHMIPTFVAAESPAAIARRRYIEITSTPDDEEDWIPRPTVQSSPFRSSQLITSTAQPPQPVSPTFSQDRIAPIAASHQDDSQDHSSRSVFSSRDSGPLVNSSSSVHTHLVLPRTEGFAHIPVSQTQTQTASAQTQQLAAIASHTDNSAPRDLSTVLLPPPPQDWTSVKEVLALSQQSPVAPVDEISRKTLHQPQQSAVASLQPGPSQDKVLAEESQQAQEVVNTTSVTIGNESSTLSEINHSSDSSGGQFLTQIPLTLPATQQTSAHAPNQAENTFATLPPAPSQSIDPLGSAPPSLEIPSPFSVTTTDEASGPATMTKPDLQSRLATARVVNNGGQPPSNIEGRDTLAKQAGTMPGNERFMARDSSRPPSKAHSRHQWPAVDDEQASRSPSTVAFVATAPLDPSPGSAKKTRQDTATTASADSMQMAEKADISMQEAALSDKPVTGDPQSNATHADIQRAAGDVSMFDNTAPCTAVAQGHKRPYEAGRDDADAISKKSRIDIEAANRTQTLDTTHVSDSLEPHSQRLPSDNAGIHRIDGGNSLVISQERQMKDYAEALERLQYRHEKQRKALIETMGARDRAIAALVTARSKAESHGTLIAEARAQRDASKAEAQEARTALLHPEPGDANQIDILKEANRTLSNKNEALEKRITSLTTDLQYIRTLYQEMTSKGTEMASEKTDLEERVQTLNSKVAVLQAQAVRKTERATSALLMDENARLRAMLDERTQALNAKDEELAKMKEAQRGRMETRGNATPRAVAEQSGLEAPARRRGSPKRLDPVSAGRKSDLRTESPLRRASPALESMQGRTKARHA